jgi:phage terminase large subunit
MFAAPHAAPQRRPVQRYEPRGGAKALLAAKDPDILAVGPAGTGKTLAACYKAHFTLLRYDGARGLMCRQVLEDLKSGALTTYINGVHPERAGVKEFGGNRFYPAEFRYPNGSVMLVVGLDKPGKVMSAEFDFIYPNEATELTAEDTWQKLKSRLRNGATPYQQIFGDANPSYPQHWLNQRCNAGLTRRIVSTHKDNPAYWDADRNDWTPLGKQYVVDTLGSLTGVERARLLDGVWVAAEGLVYPMFTDDMIRPTWHPIEGSESMRLIAKAIPDGPVDVTGWSTYLGVDVGSRNPTVILTGHVAGDERVHISQEIYRRNLSSTDILDAITTEADRSDPEVIFIDPSAKGVITDLERLGYPVLPAANDVLEGIRQTKSVLNRGFTIDPSCTETIGEFGAYAYPSKKQVDNDKPVKDHDHAMDALRYLCMGALEPVIDLAEFYRSLR